MTKILKECEFHGKTIHRSQTTGDMLLWKCSVCLKQEKGRGLENEIK